jgi:hypothetical protein
MQLLLNDKTLDGRNARAGLPGGDKTEGSGACAECKGCAKRKKQEKESNSGIHHDDLDRLFIEFCGFGSQRLTQKPHF